MYIHVVCADVNVKTTIDSQRDEMRRSLELIADGRRIFFARPLLFFLLLLLLCSPKRLSIL